MSKDQASLLRALVQTNTTHSKQQQATQNQVADELKKETNKWSKKKPMQILKPRLEVEVQPIDERSKEDVGELNPLEESKTRPQSEPCLEEEIMVQSTDASSMKDEQEAFVENEQSLFKEEEVKLEEVRPLASADEGIRILAVCSGKGGVGKTNVVLNTAITLKRQGKNPLIIDTDFGFTNIDVLCGVVAPYSLQDVLSGEKELKDVVVEGPEGIKIIPGGNDVVHLNDMSAAHKKVFQEQFAQLEDVDVLLIDMGAGVSKTSLLYAMFAQEILLIVTPEPTSLTDGYSLLKTMELSHFEQQIKVVVNRATDEQEALRTFKKLETTVSNFLKRITLEYVSYIHDDKAVSGSVKAQIPFVIKHPDSAPSKDVLKLVQSLFSVNQPKSRFKNMQQVLGRLMKVFG